MVRKATAIKKWLGRRCFVFFSIFVLMKLVSCNRHVQSTSSTNEHEPFAVIKEETLPENVGRFYAFDADYVIRDTLVDRQAHLRVSGDLFFNINQAKFPYYIRTRLVEIKVMTPSAFRIDAFDRDQGESVELLNGDLIISKTYESPFPEPDTLSAQGLYMVNESIDLSEVEKLDNKRLIDWWEGR